MQSLQGRLQGGDQVVNNWRRNLLLLDNEAQILLPAGSRSGSP